jgi:hypothetical protein
VAPGADRLAAALTSGQVKLNAVRTPAQITEDQTQAAVNTLERMTSARRIRCTCKR